MAGLSGGTVAPVSTGSCCILRPSSRASEITSYGFAIEVAFTFNRNYMTGEVRHYFKAIPYTSIKKYICLNVT